MRLLIWLLFVFGFWLSLPSEWNSLGSRFLGLFEFWARSSFGFSLLFLRSERSEWNPLGNFWVCAKFGFLRIFWIWFVWVCGASEASEAHSEILGFVPILGWFVFFGFGFLFLRSEQNEQSPLGNFWFCSNSEFVRIFWIWLLVFAKRAEPTRRLLGLFLFLRFVFLFWRSEWSKRSPFGKF